MKVSMDRNIYLQLRFPGDYIEMFVVSFRIEMSFRSFLLLLLVVYLLSHDAICFGLVLSLFPADVSNWVSLSSSGI